MKKLGNVVTEIRSFYSLKEIESFLEAQITDYRSVADEYSQWLGSLLRNSDALQGHEERFKKLGLLSKTKNKGKGKPSGKGKLKRSNNWIQFREIELSASEEGEAEVLFEAIEEITRKIDRIERIQKSVEELEKSGFGQDIIYVTYICDGIPEKIFLRHKKDEEFAEKFQFMADFSISKET